MDTDDFYTVRTVWDDEDREEFEASVERMKQLFAGVPASELLKEIGLD